MKSSSRQRTPAILAGSTDLASGIFHIEDIHRAIQWARSADQFRIPRSRVGGVWKVIHPSIKVRNHAESDKDFVKILEGRLEGDYCLHLEFDHNVESYGCQPFKILGGPNWAFDSLTPDQVVIPFDAPPYIVDCKPKKVANAKVPKSRHEVLRAAFKAHGVEFVVKTDDIIQQQPLLNTYQFLYGTLSAPKDQLENCAKRVIQSIKQFGGAAEARDLRSLGADDVRRGFAYAHSIGALSSDFECFYGPEFLIHTL